MDALLAMIRQRRAELQEIAARQVEVRVFFLFEDQYAATMDAQSSNANGHLDRLNRPVEIPLRGEPAPFDKVITLAWLPMHE